MAERRMFGSGIRMVGRRVGVVTATLALMTQQIAVGNDNAQLISVWREMSYGWKLTRSDFF